MRRRRNRCCEELVNDARPGDLIITIGAGSVWKIGEAVAKELSEPGVRSRESEVRN